MNQHDSTPGHVSVIEGRRATVQSPEPGPATPLSGRFPSVAAKIPPQRRARHSPGLLARIHGLLLVGVLPLAVMWVPLLRSDRWGNLTALDCLLAAVAATTLARLGAMHSWSDCERRALRIAGSAAAIGVLASVGALSYGLQADLISDYLQHAKRFAMPSILPLALLMGSPHDRVRVRRAGIAAMLFSVICCYIPLAEWLPIASVRAQGDRALGSLGNANEFGYVAMLGMLLGLSHAHTLAGQRAGKCLAAFAVGAGLIGLVISASRSALVASLCAAAYIAAKSSLGPAKKAGLGFVVLATLFVGWQMSDIYRARIGQVLESRSNELSTAARLEMQKVAFRTWLHYPFGIGFRNWENSTAEYAEDTNWTRGMVGSDSLYFDFLLGSGLIGFVCLLVCLRNCWVLATLGRPTADRIYLRAAILGAYCIGFASVCPASFCVAPFFFVIVGLAGCARQEGFSRRLVRRSPFSARW